MIFSLLNNRLVKGIFSRKEVENLREELTVYTIHRMLKNNSINPEEFINHGMLKNLLNFMLNLKLLLIPPKNNLYF